MAVNKKKVIAFYCILSSGHFNVCKSLAKCLLDKYSDKLEIYFIVDHEWEEKLKKFDSRFKFGVIEYDNDQQKERVHSLVTKIKPYLSAPVVTKMELAWNNFLDWSVLPEIDKKSEEKILEVGADFLICDQVCHLPAMQVRPYSFIVSCSPCAFGFENTPAMGDSSRVDEPEKIREFREKFSAYRAKMNKDLHDFMEKRGRKFDRKVAIDQPLNEETFSIYAYPRESDYFTEEIRKKYNLLQIDSPLLPENIPKPFELPESFSKIPGKVVYVSLGSLFSIYVDQLQRLMDTLNTIPNIKFIVSKGALGDQLKLPDNGRFWGENWVNQLAVLQSVDAAITHGGNNTYCEAFQFGVPQIILPALVDQVNNASRVEELKFGYQLDLINYTRDEMEDRLNKVLNDEDMRRRLKEASERIQKEKKILAAADYVMEFLETKLK